MDTVYSTEEAEEWFLKHHSGSVACDNGVETQEIDNFKDAKDFFRE